jgi:hypothetical protein
MADCEVCRGSGRIHLPLYGKLEASPLDVSIDLQLGVMSREYPCPECSVDVVPISRLWVAKHAGRFDRRYLPVMQKSMAHALIDSLLERGMFMFRQDDPDDRGGVRLVASVAFVAPAHVATLEQRVAERQFEVAEAVVEATVEEVANWGSHYQGRTGGSVDKSQAIGWMRTALKKVREKYGQ